MASIETFTKRQKRLERASKQDVYQYDELPQPFRIQVVHILRSAIGIYNAGHSSPPANQFWDLIHQILTRELGRFSLAELARNPADGCIRFLLGADAAGALDLIEVAFRVIDRGVRQKASYVMAAADVDQTADEAIEELNERFREHGIGYQYLGGILVRLDSQFTHAEVVLPALALLNAAGFDGPAEEFMNAFSHYRHGRDKEAIAEALKAFESTMKSICSTRKWPFPSSATAKPLLDILFQRNLIPSDLQSHFAGFRSAMEAGLPTLSNKNARHGQGATPTPVPRYFVGYALHLTASNINFLVEAFKALP